eukprot:551428-Hanusia_phi.AAC.1
MTRTESESAALRQPGNESSVKAARWARQPGGEITESRPAARPGRPTVPCGRPTRRHWPPRPGAFRGGRPAETEAPGGSGHCGPGPGSVTVSPSDSDH